ncbi:glycoside hydrolase family 38 C-terminal domain-containing protein [Mucilaginibacter gotjawali]|uniref:Alpha-mannosidase n=2 Tax=Mucilaginibacter gotjawali TaxID=1550579 RepID=A0A110B1V4_9SPHI|nr:glycoside hydrolase family 38 C-terminal domain-containing protein [Mucilaginibacter gotjawali]MBB3057306.1 alpha-mannosidase [Mucilaginibacter gotjawali]BAU52927.1 alpha-mannosidase [Mucilaginibacter gotjawali]
MLPDRSKKFRYTCFWFVLLALLPLKKAGAQTAWYIDGYHGGIYGGYPENYTRFLVDMLNKNPEWSINLEVEPETWDKVQKDDPEAYAQFKALAANQSAGGRIEFINPAYAQSYLYNISGESIIRQFSYGMAKIKAHFPNASFTTYSSEEPCFTSALPQILTSFGFKFASLKNPNTCFGGYAAAHGGELVTWIGPDGTGITTAPRYAMESLSNKSTWQTIGWENSPNYVNAAYAAGIKHPIGMTIQDAGWKGGPFMGTGPRFGVKTVYTTWRNYFENVSPKDTKPAWKATQEDLLVNLVWGSQVTQKIAQQVRVAENKIIIAEKMASLASIYAGEVYPTAALDSAWRTLLLAQHHDSWIVPYNGKPGATWADKVREWTNYTNRICDSLIRVSSTSAPGVKYDGGAYVRVYNTVAVKRNELVSMIIPAALANKQINVTGSRGELIASQILNAPGLAAKKIIFNASVPSLGYNTYHLQAGNHVAFKGATIKKTGNGMYDIETDTYAILLDPARGGVIKSLVAKKLNNKEFVDKANPRGFNELRGNFYKAGGFKSSEDHPASVQVVENGPLQLVIAIKGTIDNYPFTQYLTLGQGQQRIDLKVEIDWKGNPGIGADTPPGTYKWQNPVKAFYDDRYKLLTLFPLNLKGQKVYKNAPFDVTESHLTNTFYTTWDSIKNNVILNWVDVTDQQGKYGLALFTDHTTSYTHGGKFPLGLDVQYSGMGLWGRDYTIDGPTTISYSILPHAGKWDKSHVWTAGTKWAAPLTAAFTGQNTGQKKPSASFISMDKPGFEISSMTCKGDTLFVRLFNAEGDALPGKIIVDGKIAKAQLVNLNGAVLGDLKTEPAVSKKTAINVAMPRFGIRTLKLTGVHASKY